MLQQVFLETHCPFEGGTYRLARTLTWLETMFRPAYLFTYQVSDFCGACNNMFSNFPPLGCRMNIIPVPHWK